MSSGPWPNKFIGTHILLTEPIGSNWDEIPGSWAETRFDAIDVLFVSPFHVKDPGWTLMLGDVNLVKRFEWVIRAARSKNPSIIIIMEQFWHPRCEDHPELPKHDFELLNDDGKIKMFADSVAAFIESYYSKTLPNISGNGQVSARIQGYDVDVESSTRRDNLPKILTAVRQSLDGLAQKLNASKFSVSITPAWIDFLDATVAQSCDYINMQNYSGGYDTFPEAYLSAVPGFKKEQLAWGFCSEMPKENTPVCKEFAGVLEKARAVGGVEGFGGIYTWRINSDNYGYENIFQVWLHNFVSGTTLPNSKDQAIVQKYWAGGGRKDGAVIPPQNLN